MNMNAVGIDVSKGKSMVAILRPYGEIVSTPFEVKHTVSSIRSLIEHIQAIDGESRIVMEHTGRYYEPIVRELSQADLFVSAVNPKLIPVQIPILIVLPGRTEARSGLILLPPIGMWIVFANCLLTHLSTTIKSGANVESTTSASQKLLKSMKHLRRSFLYFQKTI